MRKVAICKPLRTPVGKFLGTLAPLEAGALGAIIIKALVERSGVDPARVDDVVFSQGYGSGEAPAIGRWSWLAAGMPIEVPGFQLDRRCGSGLQAVATAAMMVQTGVADCVLAGGVESMSNVEHYTTRARHGARMGDMELWDRLTRGRLMSQPIERFGVITGMIETAENLAKDYDISRESADEFAVRSHRNAAAAWEAGRFDEQLVPVEIPQRRGDPLVFDKDEGFRADADMATLGALRAIDGKRDPAAIVTAGNASQQNDAAAACLVVAEDKVEELGARTDPVVPQLERGGLRPEPDGDRPGPRGRAAVRTHRDRLGRHRAGGIERSFRAAGARGAQGLGLERGRFAPGHPQRQRLGDLARPSDRRHRPAHSRRHGA